MLRRVIFPMAWLLVFAGHRICQDGLYRRPPDTLVEGGPCGRSGTWTVDGFGLLPSARSLDTIPGYAQTRADKVSSEGYDLGTGF